MENRHLVDQVAPLPLMQCNNDSTNVSTLLDSNCLTTIPSLASTLSSSQIQQSCNNYSNQVVSVDSSHFPTIKDTVLNLLNHGTVINDDLLGLMNADGTALIDKCIKNLLLDDNFPSFVQLIERELKGLTDYH